MMNQHWHHFTARVFGVAIVVMMLINGFSTVSQAQMKPSMKIKLGVLPSISVSTIEDANLQNLFAEDIAHLNELLAERTGEADSVSLEYGFSISAYENIPVLLSFTKPVQIEMDKKNLYPMRIVCGYLNDGTTFFRRATITNKNALQFRLRNKNLLKRSMKISNPLFVAYVFFLVHLGQEKPKNEGSLPVSTITLEFM
jgi:hypothetical protein